jgi:hypothetical protein
MPDTTPGFLRNWHVRKEFHIGHIITIATMMFAGGASLVQMHARLGEAERRVELLEVRADAAQQDAGTLSRLLERLDERSVQQTQQLNRIERRLERDDRP